jgi:cytochrome b561
MALYGLLLAIPLAGWAYASAKGWTVTLFHTFSLPGLLPTGTLPDLLGDLHGLMANLMLAVAGLHVAAALWHHSLLRDGLLARMWRGPRG